MTSAQLSNLGNYALMALVGAVIATGLSLALVLQGTDPILWRPLMATFASSFFGTLATAVGSTFLTRLGSEPIAKQVNTLAERGVSRQNMLVLPTTTAEALRNPD